MLRAPAAAVIGSMLCLTASTAMAIGFGRVGTATVLGQPLDFAAVVNLEADESLAPECVGAEVSAGENRLGRGQVQARLETSAAGGPPMLRVTTTVRIDEPVITVQLMVGCPVRLSRQFVTFIDPPLLSEPPTTVAQAPASRATAPAAVTPAAPGAAASSPRAAKRTGVRSAKRPGTVATAASSAASAPSRMAAKGPRLTLEPAEPIMAADPAAAASAAASAPAVDPAEAEQRARERERLASLERSLEQLRQQNLQAQQNMAALQARLRESQPSRTDNLTVYGLLTLVTLLLLTVIALLWRQARMRREPAWWGSELAEPDRGPSPQSVVESAQNAWDSERTVTQMRMMAAPVEVTEPPPPPPPPPIEKKPPPTPALAEVAVPRELSVEELIDLEQQADFFVVLGQDEAAIDLLMGHVRSSGGSSPMPYLKLLEIYRRRGEREAYERIRERFNRRFNAYAPGWEVDPSDGRSLDSYAPVLVRLQSAWPDPSRAMELLESLMFRRDSSDGTFDLPAYGELLFLYSLALDLAERDTEPGSVDVLLPLVPFGGESHDETRPVEIPATARPFSSAEQEVDLHIDLNFDEPASGPKS